jgi:threonine 3-dehydrogenase
MRSAPGVEMVEVPEPKVLPGHVKLRVDAASVCGTDLHIYEWDEWSSNRIKPPRIIGHEFCGTIIEVGEGVTDRHVGQFVSSESHIVPLDSEYLKNGLGHVAPETQILGVDVDGGFAEIAVIPAQNARPTSSNIPPEVAAFQDALGNAVHTVNAGSVEGKTFLITGLGPIGLFAAAVAKAQGAKAVYGTEISPYRIDLAEKLGSLDAILNPSEAGFEEKLAELVKDGVDATLEMSGHPSALGLAVKYTKLGGRISCLGVYKENSQVVNMNEVIFKGLTIQGIVGRKLWETWDQMDALLSSGNLNVRPVVTHVMDFSEFDEAMSLMRQGLAGKVVFKFR